MARVYRFIVGPAEAGVRLDRYLVRHLPETLSRTLIQQAVRQGAVTISERPVKAHQRLRRGDRVTVRFDRLPPPPRDLAPLPQAIPLDIVFEDQHLLVVNKPPGLVTHPAPGHWNGTLVNAILWHLQAQGSRLKAEGNRLEPRASSLEQQLPRVGIIHRLDKDTSGLLIVAKTPIAHAALAKQMKARTIRRNYVALVEGRVPSETGTVRAAIGRHPVHRKEMTVRYVDGRAAVTHYRVLKRLRAPVDPTTVLDISLETGRTHQIRVHMAHLGFPVVGDPTYGKHPAGFWEVLGVHRQLLHAYAIRLLHPATRRPIELKAPVPDDMKRWVPAEAALEIRR